MRSTSAGLIIALAVAAGCGSNGKTGVPVDAGNADGGPLTVDAPADTDNADVPLTIDAPVDTGNADEGPSVDAWTPDAADTPADGMSSVVSFVFKNSTDHTIYIQLSGWSGQAYWSMVEGGKRLPVDNTCETCDCSRCPSCAVCGRSIARVKELAPGAQHTWSWDGRIWELVPDGCRANLACEQDQVVPAGAALEATVTYAASYAVDTSSGADDEYIGAPLKATVAFANERGASVEIVATQ